MGKFSGRGRKKPEKLNITSLMDALTIILIFLLVNYSEVNEEKEIPSFIELPTVEGKAAQSSFGITMVIGESQIKVGKGEIINFSNFDGEREQILVQVKEELEDLRKEHLDRNIASNKKDDKIKLTIQADKDVPYLYIDEIIRGASELSLNYVDFVSMNKEKN